MRRRGVSERCVTAIGDRVCQVRVVHGGRGFPIGYSHSCISNVPRETGIGVGTRYAIVGWGSIWEIGMVGCTTLVRVVNTGIVRRAFGSDMQKKARGMSSENA